MDKTEKVVKRDAYVTQTESWVHEKQTLACEFGFAPSGVGNDERPVLELHAGYSRIDVALLDNSTGTQKILRCAIKADEIPVIVDNYHTALGIRANLVAASYLQKQPGTDSAESLSPAYTVKITTGTFKGKTPAEILLTSDDAAQQLRRTRDWLQKNVQKYPNNKIIIEAIQDGLELYAEGDLQAVATTSAPDVFPPFAVFSADHKVISARSGDDKKTECTVSIQFEQGKNFPWSFCIGNSDFYETGNQQRNYTDKRSATFRMSDKEFAQFIDMLATQKRLFENLIYPSQYDQMQQNRWQPGKQ